MVQDIIMFDLYNVIMNHNVKFRWLQAKFLRKPATINLDASSARNSLVIMFCNFIGGIAEPDNR